MNDVVLLVLLVGLGMLTFFFAVRLPPRKTTLDRASIGSAFHGLILFGMNGAYVSIDQKSPGDRILFTKRCKDGGDWALEVAVSGPNASEARLDKVKSELEVLGNRFKVETGMGEGGDQFSFFLAGADLADPAALESVGRLVIRHLGHPSHAKYRVTFEGSKDNTAVAKYFGFKR
jgi:hypothetical protein